MKEYRTSFLNGDTDTERPVLFFLAAWIEFLFTVVL